MFGGARQRELSGDGNAQEPAGSKRGEIDGRLLAENDLCEQACRCWGEEDAVAEVSCGEEVAGSGWVRAEDGELVDGGGTEAGPNLEDGRVVECGKELSGLMVEELDVSGVDGLIEACVLDGGADEGAAGVGTGGAGHDVKVFGAENEQQRRGLREVDREHLAFARLDGLRKGAGPGSAAIDEVRGMEASFGCDDREPGAGPLEIEQGSVGAKIDGGVLRGSEECGCELAGIDGVLVEKREVIAAEIVRGKKDIEIGSREGVDGLEVGCLKREVGLKGDAEIGEGGDVIEVRGIELEGEIGKGLEQRWMEGIVGGEHSGGGGGGLSEGRPAIEHGDAGTATGELQGKGKTHDACSGDTHIGMLHGSSLGDGDRGREATGYIVTHNGSRAEMLRRGCKAGWRRVMSESERVVERSASGAFLAVVGAALLAAVGALVWCYVLQSHLGAADGKLVLAEQANADLTKRLAATDARLRATSETLGQSVGLTQRQLDAKAEKLLAIQTAQAQHEAQLEREQAATTKQIGAVSSDVASVKTDVGGVKTDVATTRSDLETTKTQLGRVVGDAGVMSGLIAKNGSELEILKHRGDRNYFEFSLQKGAKPTLLSTVKLQLKKVDEKRSKYTMDVSADDKNIQKKDKNLDEPVQFYTGKDPVLYELVVNVIEKNRVSGYLSTPKGAPQPAAAP